jgi:hypothetical protein
MKLGEMLVRDGRLTEPQLTEALGYQARDGARLGTVLVEHSMVDLEALTVYLGLELGIPIATGAMLERAKRAAVRLLQPVQAFKHKCVPLVVQDRQLIAAIEDPHDFATLEALTSITGYRVLPRVAPELRIYYYIERYYGVARPPRFSKFGDSPRGNEAAVDSGLPAPPLPGLPPVPAAPAEAASSTAPLQPSAPAAARTPGTPPFGPPPMAADLALRELAIATNRNRIVEVLLGYAAAVFDAAVVFAVRDNLAFGWRAIGDLPGHANVEHVLIPLEAPSVVQAAIAAEGYVFHGPLAPSTVNSYLYKVLGCAEPPIVSAGAIAIGKRVVNVLYGHSPSLSPLQLHVLQEICHSAAEAYARLIAVSKKKR